MAVIVDGSNRRWWEKSSMEAVIVEGVAIASNLSSMKRRIGVKLWKGRRVIGSWRPPRKKKSSTFVCEILDLCVYYIIEFFPSIERVQEIRNLKKDIYE